MFFSTAAVSSINSRVDTYLCKAAWRFGRALLLLKHTWIPRIYLYTVIHGNQKKKQKRRCRIRCAFFQAGESTVQGAGGYPCFRYESSSSHKKITTKLKHTATMSQPTFMLAHRTKTRFHGQRYLETEKQKPRQSTLASSWKLPRNEPPP